MGYDTLGEWDHIALHWINGHHYPVLDWILIVVSSLGEVGAVWIATGLLMAIFGRGRTRATGLLLLGAMVVTDRIATWAIGGPLYRARPYVEDSGMRQIGIRWTGNAFPSAHAHSVMIATILLGSQYPRLLPALIPFALLSLYSRPYLGMHHPLDVVVGAGIGALAGLGAVALRRWWLGKAPSSPGAGETRPAVTGRDPPSRRDRDQR